MQVRYIPNDTKKQKKRVAAYCRVSTDSNDQQESFKTQKRYYTKLISETSGWTSSGIYADEGKSGTDVKHRPQFMQMMEDARIGRFDIILTKSISRFARNSVDCQRYVKELKSLDVEVRFEREGISSMDSTADFIFSVLAAVAQEESHSISENVKWRLGKDFQNGIYHFGNNRILGYDMDEDGKLVPNEDAWIIRQVFDNYLASMDYSQIANSLNSAGAKRLRTDKPFTSHCVGRILRGEYYVGDVLLQKNPPRDFITKKPMKNINYDSYYVRDNHEGIIDRDTWEMVKAKLDTEIKKRAQGIYSVGSNTHFLYGKVFCGACNEPCTRITVTLRTGTKYKAWSCRGRAKKNGCTNPHVREDELLGAITAALDIDEFDRDAFDSLVERVVVTADGLRVVLRE